MTEMKAGCVPARGGGKMRLWAALRLQDFVERESPVAGWAGLGCMRTGLGIGCMLVGFRCGCACLPPGGRLVGRIFSRSDLNLNITRFIRLFKNYIINDIIPKYLY